jgi:hypothetical protein
VFFLAPDYVKMLHYNDDYYVQLPIQSAASNPLLRYEITPFPQVALSVLLYHYAGWQNYSPDLMYLNFHHLMLAFVIEGN